MDGGPPRREQAFVLLAQAEMGLHVLDHCRADLTSQVPHGIGLGPAGCWPRAQGPEQGNRSGEVTSLSSVELRGFLAKCTSITLLVVRFLTPQPVARSSPFCPVRG